MGAIDLVYERSQAAVVSGFRGSEEVRMGTGVTGTGGGVGLRLAKSRNVMWAVAVDYGVGGLGRFGIQV